jgi:hypothetical protein
MLVSKMNKDTSKEYHPIKLFGMMLPSIPKLTLRLTANFLRFKRNANKAGKVFKKELLNQGIDNKTASELTDIYLEGSHIHKYIQNFQ